MAIDEAKLKNTIAERMAKTLGGALFEDSELAESRNKALKYYNGEVADSIIKNGSKAVSRDVAEVVDAALPSLLRTFAAGEEVVKCTPKADDDNGDEQEDVTRARKIELYLNRVFARSETYMFIQSWIKDGLLSRVAFAKAYWQDDKTSKTIQYRDLTPEEVQASGAQDIGNGIFEASEEINKGKIVLECIPPEEMYFSLNAKSIDDCGIIAHGRLVTASELREMGFTPPDSTYSTQAMVNDQTTQLRNQGETNIDWGDYDKSQEGFMLFEGYTKIDISNNGKGIAQLYKIYFIDQDCKVLLKKEPVNFSQFAAWSAGIMPHRLIGKSIADDVVDIQDQKTDALRSVLDAMALANAPRRFVDKRNHASMENLSKNLLGQNILLEDINGVVVEQLNDAMGHGLKAIEYLDSVRETRTGIRRAGSALDGIENAYEQTLGGIEKRDASQDERIEMYARNFGELGIKPLCKIILNLAKLHEPEVIQIKDGTETIEINPKNFDPDVDIDIKFGLGTRDKSRHLQNANALYQFMSGVVEAQASGIIPKFVSEDAMFEAGKEVLTALGFKNYESFIQKPKPIDLNAPPNPDPAILEAQAKIQFEEKKLQEEMALKREQMNIEADLERRKQDLEIELRREQMRMGIMGSANVGSVHMGGRVG